MSKQSISIITATFNAGSTIRRTLESVLAQTQSVDEYIIVDGGSTDDTLDILESYSDKYRLKIISEKDDGIYDAFNKGIRLANGDIIGILNAGDWYEADTIVQVGTEMAHHPVDLLCGIVRYHDVAGGAHYWIPVPEHLNREMTLGHPAVFVLRDTYLKRVGLFDASFRIAGDYDFAARAYSLGASIGVTSKVIVNMTDGGASWSNWRVSFREASAIRRKYFHGSFLYLLFQLARTLVSRWVNNAGLVGLLTYYRKRFAAIPKQVDRPVFDTRIVSRAAPVSTT